MLFLRFAVPALLTVLVADLQAVRAEPQATRTRLALLPTEVVNVDAAQQDAMRRLLRERLRARNGFLLIPDERIEPLVQEQGSCARRAACLQRLGEKLDGPMLLQLAIAGLGSTYVLRLTLFDSRSGARAGSWQEVLDDLNPQRVSKAFDRMIAGFAPRSALERKPWYAKWWLWTAVAGAVAAGTVTAVLLATGNDTPPADVIITPP
jgi:hypothetical protein